MAADEGRVASCCCDPALPPPMVDALCTVHGNRAPEPGRGTTLVCPRCMDNLVQHKGEIGYYCGRCDEAWTYIPGRHRWSDVSAPARETST